MAQSSRSRPSSSAPEPIASGTRWINWKARKGQKRIEKIPISPRDGRVIDPTDASNGGRLEIAVKRAPRRLGLLVHPPLVVIDLDLAVVENTREIEPWAQAIVDQVRSYTEVSPGGLGLHILAMGVIPANRKKPHVEMYKDARFVTYTGAHLPGTPTRVEVRVAELRQLWFEQFGTNKVRRPVKTAQPSVLSLRQSDEDLLQRASEISQRVVDLYAGTTQGYPSQSEADLALCSYLAMVTDDASQVDRIFRTSGLMRPKWDRADYSEGTLKRAFQTKRKYSPTNVEELLIHYDVDPFRTPTEWAIWFSRLRIEQGKQKPAHVRLKPLNPIHANESVRKTYEGFRLLLQCHWLRFPKQPVLFSERFAAKWCRLGSEATAWRAIRQLMRNGYIYVAGIKHGSKFGDTPLYLPVTRKAQVNEWHRPSVSEPPEDWEPQRQSN